MMNVISYVNKWKQTGERHVSFFLTGHTKKRKESGKGNLSRFVFFTWLPVNGGKIIFAFMSCTKRSREKKKIGTSENGKKHPKK